MSKIGTSIRSNLGKSLAERDKPCTYIDMIQKAQASKADLNCVTMKVDDDKNAEVAFQFDTRDGNRYYPMKVTRASNSNGYSQVAVAARSLGMSNLNPTDMLGLEKGQYKITKAGVKKTR